jgi:hypothetical protein
MAILTEDVPRSHVATANIAVDDTPACTGVEALDPDVRIVEVSMDENDDLVVAVEYLMQAQDRYGAEYSDGGSTGKSDDPRPEGDGLNFPEQR